VYRPANADVPAAATPLQETSHSLCLCSCSAACLSASAALCYAVCATPAHYNMPVYAPQGVHLHRYTYTVYSVYRVHYTCVQGTSTGTVSYHAYLCICASAQRTSVPVASLRACLCRTTRTTALSRHVVRALHLCVYVTCCCPLCHWRVRCSRPYACAI